MPYTQAAFAFTPPTRTPRERVPDRTPPRHNRRLPDDLWGEYRLECAMREQFHLPDVSLAEFRDLRDWVDGIEETDDDDDWIAHPDVPPYGNHP